MATMQRVHESSRLFSHGSESSFLSSPRLFASRLAMLSFGRLLSSDSSRGASLRDCLVRWYSLHAGTLARWASLRFWTWQVGHHLSSQYRPTRCHFNASNVRHFLQRPKARHVPSSTLWQTSSNAFVDNRASALVRHRTCAVFVKDSGRVTFRVPGIEKCHAVRDFDQRSRLDERNSISEFTCLEWN